MEQEKNRRTIVILGPTCSGKSDIAFELARENQAEIISCDSMQVYKGLEIGTAMPSPAMRQAIPHHLVDCFDIFQRYDASIFVEKARAAIDDVHSRGHRAIIVGGTGLYARALVYGLNLLPSDHNLSMSLRPLLESEEGRILLWNELVSAVKREDEIPDDIRLNPRHLLRAVEVLRLTGLPPWKQATKNEMPSADFIQFCILPDLDILKQKIRCRTIQMLRNGWIEEAIDAGKRGLLETPTAHQALGYRDIIDFFLATPHGDIEELTEILVSRTIAYARRQMTWFRHQHPGSIQILHSESQIILDSIKSAI